jgi:hypothetical protein
MYLLVSYGHMIKMHGIKAKITIAYRETSSVT